RPIEGVTGLINLTKKTVIDVTDVNCALPPVDDAEPSKARQPAKRLITSLPDGPSYARDGHEISWQNSRFRWSLRPREGLILHTVGYEDGGRVRPILYRASLSELVVPYADAAETWNWRVAFDQGEFGLGRAAESLRKGIDVPEHAELLD